jgi:hypothetical protein
MNRVLAGLLGVGLAACAGAVPAAAQESGLPSTIVDLSDRDLDSGRGRDGREVAQGDDADSISYTIVENPDSTGDATTAVAPAAPDLSRVPVMSDGDETTVAPPSGEPVSAPIDGVPPAGVAGDVTTADPAGEAAAPAAACADFATWYDAQVFYESMGGPAGSAELVASVDPDADGFACEELIEYS